MRLVQLALMLPLLLGPGSALARPWRGITPGTTASAEVEKKFGEPTTRTKRGGRTVLAYYGDQALEGTKQAQFHLDAGGVVQEITIFLNVPLDAETVEGTYGKSAQKTFVEDTFQKVWVFASQGVTIYWSKDGGGAEAISFAPSRSEAGKGEREAPKAPAGKAEPDAGKAGKGN
jgi:hypothetical protein